jgi:hypothetical protein
MEMEICSGKLLLLLLIGQWSLRDLYYLERTRRNQEEKEATGHVKKSQGEPK